MLTIPTNHNPENSKSIISDIHYPDPLFPTFIIPTLINSDTYSPDYYKLVIKWNTKILKNDILNINRYIKNKVVFMMQRLTFLFNIKQNF